MKIKLCFVLVLFVALLTKAQEIKKIESLDTFFAGIPLQKYYTDWVQHINGEPDLGIDSIGKRGLYSSFKQTRKNHFPFPDSVQVKLLLYTALNVDSSGRFSVDTITSLTIEGVFGNGKQARKDADKYFKELRSMLKTYYHSSNSSPSGNQAGFFNGMNKSFPDVIIEKAYFENKKFYYVVLHYERRQRLSFKIK